MGLIIRVVSGLFLAGIGIALCLESQHVESLVLKVVFLASGICAIGLGLFVIAKSPKNPKEMI